MITVTKTYNEMQQFDNCSFLYEDDSTHIFIICKYEEDFEQAVITTYEAIGEFYEECRVDDETDKYRAVEEALCARRIEFDMFVPYVGGV